MPEKILDKTIFSLLEVTRSVQKTISERYKSEFWVKAEMNKLNLYKHSGHSYPELVEKIEGKVVAQIRSILWRDDYNRVNSEFLRTLKEPLKDGIKILFLAQISFDPIHGLSLRIIDIDPSYTLGDLEREKQETIDKLQQEEIYTNNKKLKIPQLPKRIAIISVETSKGYADFTRVLESNPWNYHFFHMLFPSVLQGEKAVTSICNQLQRIKKVKKHFDVVAIIRGGGGDVGLSCYNNYTLARAIALFPLPVITGIGHATNFTVSEMVAFENAITPTKIAEYLLQKFHNFSVPVQQAKETIFGEAEHLIERQKTNLKSTIKLFKSEVRNKLTVHKNYIKEQAQNVVQNSLFIFRNENADLNRFSGSLKKDANTICKTQKLEIINFQKTIKEKAFGLIKSEENELNYIQKNVQNMSPEKVLKRGYSITLKNGKSIRDINALKQGDEITTIIFNGEMQSIVKKIQNKNDTL